MTGAETVAEKYKLVPAVPLVMIGEVPHLIARRIAEGGLLTGKAGVIGRSREGEALLRIVPVHEILFVLLDDKAHDLFPRFIDKTSIPYRGAGVL